MRLGFRFQTKLGAKGTTLAVNSGFFKPKLISQTQTVMSSSNWREQVHNYHIGLQIRETSMDICEIGVEQFEKTN